ncbi:MAG TPA: hypothetical protein VGB83_00760 [Actinomycetota bacterium]
MSGPGVWEPFAGEDEPRARRRSPTRLVVAAVLAVALGAFFVAPLLSRDSPIRVPADAEPVAVVSYIAGNRHAVVVVDEALSIHPCPIAAGEILSADAELIYYRHARDFYAVDVRCRAEPRLLIDGSAIPPERFLTMCFAPSPDGRFQALGIAGDDGRRTVVRDDATGMLRTVAGAPACRWIDDDHLVVAAEADPIVIDALGAPSFLARPDFGLGQPSPDGRSVAFEDEVTGEIVIVGPGGTRVRSPNGILCADAWSPASTRILFGGLERSSLSLAGPEGVEATPWIVSPGTACGWLTGELIWWRDAGGRVRVTSAVGTSVYELLALPGQTGRGPTSVISIRDRAPAGAELMTIEQATRRDARFGFAYVLPPGWRARPCRSCSPLGDERALELIPRREFNYSLFVEPYVTIARRDGRPAAVRREILAEQEVTRGCNELRCRKVWTGRRTIGHRELNLISIGHWEGGNTLVLIPGGDETYVFSFVGAARRPERMPLDPLVEILIRTVEAA